MGLLLRPDAYYAETADGAYVLTHQGELSLTGRSVYQLIERLAPYLDGRHSLAELTGGLPEPRRRIVEDLLITLQDRGAIQDLADGDGAVRAARTALVGSGVLLAMARRAADRAGLTLDAAEPELVVHVADRMSREEAESSALRFAGGVPVFQATAANGTVWSGALVAGWRRLTAWQPELFAGNDNTPALAATVAMSQLVHRALREHTGPVPDQVVAVDTTTLETRTHSFRPHPLDRPAATPTRDGFRDRIDALRAAPPLDAETFSRQAMRCVDERVGLIGPPTERDYEQIPLHVCEIAVSNPVGLLPAGATPTVIGTGLDFATARHRAAVHAFACYASLMVDPRRLNEDSVWGFDLIDEDVRPVAAARAFPALHHAEGRYTPPIGVAAGYSWTEAVAAGLLAHCRQLSLRTAEARTRIDLPDLDPTGTRYLGMLTAIGLPLKVFLLDGPLAVPTVVSSLDGRPVACASGLTVAEAIRDCLGQTVLHYQSEHSGQPAYAPEPLPALPPEGARTSQPVSTVVGALRRLGYRPVVTLLDHDPEATAVLPHLLHVVLDDV